MSEKLGSVISATEQEYRTLRNRERLIHLAGVAVLLASFFVGLVLWT